MSLTYTQYSTLLEDAELLLPSAASVPVFSCHLEALIVVEIKNERL